MEMFGWCTQRWGWRCLVTVTVTFLLSACGGTAGESTSSGNGSQQSASLSKVAALGKRIFHDPSLSASGQMSCATCHDDAHGFAQPSASGVSDGGAQMNEPGVRNAPSLTYLNANPPFYFDDEGTPTGGFDRDG